MTSPSLLHGQITASDFRPHPALAGAHLQTIAASLLRPTPALEIRRERLELTDGDFVDLGRCGADAGPLVVLIHGLGGGFDSKYLRGTARQLIARGFRCVILQLRGGGPAPNRLPRSYHHGDTGDLRFLLAELRRREPDTPLYAVGWSLGGNVLLKYLGEEAEQTPLTAAVAASPPFLIRDCAEHLRRGFARIYQRRLMNDLKDILRRKFAQMPSPIDLEAALRAADFFEFDDAATAPLNGFASALDYYERCSNRQFLSLIRRPTLIIHAADDPFMTPAIVPPAEELAPDVMLELSARGGHVGFIAADGWGRPWLWLESRIAQHLAQLEMGTARPIMAATLPALHQA
jgi:hypothetical protein